MPMRLIVSLVMAGLLLCPAINADSPADSSRPEPAENTPAKLEVRLESLLISDMTVADTIDILFTGPDSLVAGVDLKIGTDSRYFEITEVLRGEIIDSCRWELFNAGKTAPEIGVDYPGQLWRVTALAKSSPGDSRPLCFGLGRTASICRLVLSSEGRSQIPDHSSEIFFYWQTCRDNVLSDISGEKMMISLSVDGRSDSLNAVQDFPSRSGHPESCIDMRRKNHPLRMVSFVNSQIEFKADAGSNDSTGLE